MRPMNRLNEEATSVKPDADGLVALDWLNGRRTPYADQNVKGMIAGITLGSSAPEVYRSLVESTAFGLRRIIEHMRSQGLTIQSMNAVGGIAKKAPFVMQVLADIIGMPIQIIESENACALGAAMFAAVVSGIYSSIEDADSHMKSPIEKVYIPNPDMQEVYHKLYSKYILLGKTAEQFI